jgi:hypothetical protein
LASPFIGHATQKSKLHNLQYDEGGNQMAETETDTIKKNSSSMMHQKKKESYLIIY